MIYLDFKLELGLEIGREEEGSEIDPKEATSFSTFFDLLLFAYSEDFLSAVETCLSHQSLFLNTTTTF